MVASREFCFEFVLLSIRAHKRQLRFIRSPFLRVVVIVIIIPDINRIRQDTQKLEIDEKNTQGKPKRKTNRIHNRCPGASYLARLRVCISSVLVWFPVPVSCMEGACGCVQVSNSLLFLIVYVQTPHFSTSTSCNSSCTTMKRFCFSCF